MFITNQRQADRIVEDTSGVLETSRWISFEENEIRLGDPGEEHTERLHRRIKEDGNVYRAVSLVDLEETLFEAFPDLFPNTRTVVKSAYNALEGEWQLDIDQYDDDGTPKFATTAGGEKARKIATATGDAEALGSYLNTHRDPALSQVYETYSDMCFGLDTEIMSAEPYMQMLDIAFDTYATRDFAPVRDVCPEWDEMDAEDQGAWLAEHVGSIVSSSFMQMEESLHRPYGIEGLDRNFSLPDDYDVGDYYDKVGWASPSPVSAPQEGVDDVSFTSTTPAAR